LPPRDLYLSEDELFHILKDKKPNQVDVPMVEVLPSVAIDPSSKNALENLKGFLSDFPGRTLFVTDHEGRLDVLKERLAPLCSLPAQPASWNDFLKGTERIGVSVATLNAGFILSDAKLAVITESDLYPDYVRPKKEKKIITRAGEAVIKELGELSIGCTVVHDLHGIGRYLGLERLSLAEGESEFLVLEYAGGDRLYVPIEQLALVSRYIGIDEPLLHKLGSGQWEKARQKAWIKARDTASELLEIYAKREDVVGFNGAATELHAATGGVGEEWDHAVVMGACWTRAILCMAAMTPTMKKMSCRRLTSKV